MKLKAIILGFAIIGMMQTPQAAFSQSSLKASRAPDIVVELENRVRQLRRAIRAQMNEGISIGAEIDRLNTTLDIALRSANDMEDYRQECLDREESFIRTRSSFDRSRFADCINRYAYLLNVMETYIGNVSSLRAEMERVTGRQVQVEVRIEDLRADLTAEQKMVESVRAAYGI